MPRHSDSFPCRARWRSAAFCVMLASSPYDYAQGLDNAATQPLGSVYQPALPPLSNQFPLSADTQSVVSGQEGQTFTFSMAHSAIFPNTTRTITIYVPAAYRGDKPACVYVGLDGLSFKAANVFDHLIADGSMPVTIAIGIAPGVVDSAKKII